MTSIRVVSLLALVWGCQDIQYLQEEELQGHGPSIEELAPRAPEAAEAEEAAVPTAPVDDALAGCAEGVMPQSVAWTPGTLEARSLKALRFRVDNQGDKDLSYSVRLTWNQGVSASSWTTLGSVDVPAMGAEHFTIDPADLPKLAGEHMPGLLQVSLAAKGADGLVLDSFYVQPTGDEFVPEVAHSARALWTEDELVEVYNRDNQGEGIILHQTMWTPSTTTMTDADGGVR